MTEGPVVYDADADALYVTLLDTPVHRSASLDDLRIIDYSADGAVIGIEFINASAGVDLSDLPFARKVETLIGESGLPFKILA